MLATFAQHLQMDGVLADFMSGAYQVLGHAFDDHSTTDKATIKEKIAKRSKFWETLPQMPDAMQLWKFINRYNAEILTAYPSWDESGKRGKRIWVENHLGSIPSSRFHAVRRDEKKDYAVDDKKRPNILIDDYLRNIKEFESAGGIGIHHTDARTTISKLQKLGF